MCASKMKQKTAGLRVADVSACVNSSQMLHTLPENLRHVGSHMPENHLRPFIDAMESWHASPWHQRGWEHAAAGGFPLRCSCVWVYLPGGSVGQDGHSRGRRRSLWLGGGRLAVRLSGGGGKRLRGVAEPAGGAAAGGGVPVVAEIVQAGAARVTGAVTWGKERKGKEVERKGKERKIDRKRRKRKGMGSGKE